MKTINALALVSLLLLAACKKGEEAGNQPPPVAPPPPPAVNRAPVANAGVDGTGMTGETLNLHGQRLVGSRRRYADVLVGDRLGARRRRRSATPRRPPPAFRPRPPAPTCSKSRCAIRGI